MKNKLQKAMILLNKHERCTFQSPVLRCFVYSRYRANSFERQVFFIVVCLILGGGGGGGGGFG